jgi:hypothetical protein
MYPRYAFFFFFFFVGTSAAFAVKLSPELAPLLDPVFILRDELI